MRIVFAFVLLAGVGLAGFAVVQTQAYISGMQQELAEARASQGTAVEMVTIVTANRNLRYGERITRDDLRPARFPVDALPVGALTDIRQVFPEGVTHRTMLRTTDEGEPVLASKLTAPGTEAGITSHLSAGKRAFTIPVNQTSGVGGFLRPGDHVDIFWTGRTRDSGEVTQLIQSQVRIIAVDQSADMDRREQVVNARNVTVEATPEQAAALAQANSSGRLSLALRGINDQGISEGIEMTQDRLLGVVRQERVVEEVEERCHIRTRRGNELIMIEVPCTN